MVQRNGFVVIAFRPRLFWLRRWVQFFRSSSSPPATGFSSVPGRVVLARSRDVILRLRLHRGPAHTKVTRKLSHCRKLSRRLQMVARVAMFASETEMRFAIESE